MENLKETRGRAKEATQRVADMEEWAVAAKEVPSQWLNRNKFRLN